MSKFTIIDCNNLTFTIRDDFGGKLTCNEEVLKKIADQIIFVLQNDRKESSNITIDDRRQTECRVCISHLGYQIFMSKLDLDSFFKGIQSFLLNKKRRESKWKK